MTMALSELVSQGHDFKQLLDGLPASVVKGLLAAAHVRRRLRLAEQGAAFSMAVTGALDLALNQGKGKVLDHWIKAMTDEGKETPQKKSPEISDRAMAFFDRIPKRKVETAP